jgi:transcriptional regulator with XRE-family HTH domain
VNDIRFGLWLRAARRRLGLRQSDVGRVAGLSASAVSRAERGLVDRLTVASIRAIAAAVGIEFAIVPRSPRLGDLDRQIDRRHAALVDAVVIWLRGAGWQVWTEYSFNHYGDRGSVDVLAWHPGRRVLLIVEVKSELRDLQDMLRALDVKRRVVPARVRDEMGLDVESTAILLVVPESSTERDFVDRYRATFQAALPARNVAVRKWLADPVGEMRGLWFFRICPGVVLPSGRGGGRRVRLPQGGSIDPAERG